MNLCIATCSISITLHGSINRWIVCVGVCLCELVFIYECVYVCEQKLHSYPCYFVGFRLHFVSFCYSFRLLHFLLFHFTTNLIVFTFVIFFYVFICFLVFLSLLLLLCFFFFNINAFCVVFFLFFFSLILFCINDFYLWRSKPLHLFRSVAVGSLQLKLCLSFLYNQSYIYMQCYGLVL